ncbi:hypothetical protein WJX73_006894 [Symbiochloris irregularis]|uniref:RNA polymerase-associated protein CTR9-like protein n=1 Tax=Symbiochloris irregularis TaxID=706552 RepID=A0AAW1P7X0_9CHLO
MSSMIPETLLVPIRESDEVVEVPARTTSYHELLPHLGLGQLSLAQGNTQQARESFERAAQSTNDGRKSVAGTLALASWHFQQQKYQEALKLYSLSFSTAANDQAAMAKGLDFLCQAYNSDPDYPGAIALLSHYCLVHGDYDKAKQLAQHGASTAENPAMQADSLVHLARAYHACSQWQDAFNAYGQVKGIKDVGKLPVPLLGLAQMHLLQRDGVTSAIGLLESALQQVPGWPDALQALGPLYQHARHRNPDSVLPQFKAAAQKGQGSAEMWETLGELLATTDSAAALQACTAGVDLYRKAAADKAAAATRRARRARAAENGHTGNERLTPELGNMDDADLVVQPEALPAKLLNNAAVLHMAAGEAVKALHLLEEAVQSAQSPASEGVLPEGSQVTLGYNLARVREAAGQLHAAASDYRSILTQFPGYLACHQRLAAIACRRNDFEGAERQLREALAISPDDPDTMACLGCLQMQHEQYSEAEATFLAMIKLPGCKHDAYVWQALGVLNLHKAQALLESAKPEAKQGAQKKLEKAIECFSFVITRVPGNVYAAHGLGAVLAEQGHLNAAQNIFAQVQEAVVGAGSRAQARMPELAANLASIQLAMGHYQTAQQRYSAASLRFFHGASPRLLLHLARTLYHSNQMDEARSMLLKALHQDPSDHVLRFDVALVLQEFAQRIASHQDLKSKAGELRRGDDYLQALVCCSIAKRNFERLERLGAAAAVLGDHKTSGKERLRTHAKFCQSLEGKITTLVKQANEEELAHTKREEQNRRALQAAQSRAQLEAERKAATAAAAKSEQEARAKAAADRLAALRGKWADDAALIQAAEAGNAERVAKSRKKKKRKAEDDQMFASDNEEDGVYEPGQQQQGQLPDDEVEWQGQDASDNENAAGNGDAALHTGLTDSDEDEAAALNDQGAGADASQQPQQAGTPAAGRLRKRQHDAMEEAGEPPDGEQQGMQGLEEEVLEDDVDNNNGGDGQAGLEEQPPGDDLEEDLEDTLGDATDVNPAKRARNVRMLDSDDEED